MSDTTQYPGYFGPPEGVEGNNDQFAIDREQARIMTSIPVKVIKVYAGDYTNKDNQMTLVDVMPMVDMTNPQGKRTAHDKIYGIAVQRIHAGGNAFLIDPVVGDVGHMVVSHRDISSLKKNNGSQSGPGSARRHDLADGVYHGGMWTPKAVNFIDARGGNLALTTPGDITHTAQGNIVLNAGKQIQMGGGTGDDVYIKPSSGKKVYLGGDPGNGGVFSPVSTVAGPSDNTLAHVSGPT